MDFESVLKNIGAFGRYQKLLIGIISYVLMSYTLQLYVQVFSAGKSDHWCASWEHEECPDTGIDCSSLKKDLSVPKVTHDADETVEYEQCLKYNVSGIDLATAIKLGKNVTTRLEEIPCDEGWEHDRSVFSDTMIMDFQLVCGRSALPNIAQSTYFAGYMAGSAFGGLTSDLIGRRLAILISIACTCITSLAIAVAPVMSLYTALRFFVGFFVRMIANAQFVLLMEVVAPGKRILLSNVYFLAFALSYLVLTGLAKLIYRWRILQTVISLLLAVGLLPVYFFVLESPRWLFIKGKTEKALKITNKIAAVNGKDIVLREEDLKNAEVANKPESSDMIGILKQLVRSPVMLFMIANMAFHWVVQSFVFYGLTLSTSSLGIDPYLSFLVSGAVEIPAYIACMFVPEWLGRRLSMTIIMVIGGICCCCSTIFPAGVTRALIAMGGKFCITMTFSIVSTWSTELLPTSARATGMGFFSMCSRVGGIVAPLILLFEDVWMDLPYLIFGVVAIVTAPLALLMPETKGKPLPTTLEETRALYRKNPETKKDEEFSHPCDQDNECFTSVDNSEDPAKP